MHVGLLVLVAMAGTPDSRAPLRLRLEQCPDIDQTTVGRVVATELESSLADGRQTGAVTTAKAECENGSVRITIDDPVTAKTTTRTVPLERQPRDLGSRLLGLAISEAVLASWLELQLTPEPPPSQPNPETWSEFHQQVSAITGRKLQATPRRRSSSSWEILLGPSLRGFTSGLRTFGAGGTARYWVEQQRITGLGVDVDVGLGERMVANVASSTATSVSLAPCLLMASDFVDARVSASTGYRLGLARLSAIPTSVLRTGRTAWRGWSGVFLAADLSVSLPAALLLRIGVESGYTIIPARGLVDSVEAIALDGAWLSVLVSVGRKL